MRGGVKLMTIWIACGLGSVAEAAAPTTAVDRWLAVADASAPARARFFEMSRRVVSICPERAAWTLGDSPFYVQREAPTLERARQIREIVMREFAAQPGEYVFTVEPGPATPFGAAGARRGDRLTAVDAGRWNVLEEVRERQAAGAEKRSYRELYGELGAELAARPQRRFALRRGGEELPVTVTAVQACNVGFNAVDSQYSYADGRGNDVFVTLPLVASLDDDGLTMVLANELSRVLLKQTAPPGIVLALGKLAPFGTLLNAAANRELDAFPPPNADLVAADRLTLWILRSYGIAPAAYLQFLTRMEGLSDPRLKATYVRTRPLTPDRARALEDAAASFAASRTLPLPHALSLEQVNAVVAAGDPGAVQVRVATAPRRGHRIAPPPPSGYASVEDLDRVPVRPEGKDRFRHYLTLPVPKAFFVYAGGGWRFWSGPDAITKGLEFCQREQRRCWLYAVDDEVVWQADESRRVGSQPAAPANAEEGLR